MFSENSRKQSSIYRQILGRQTKHVNMCIRGPVLGRKSIDLIIRKDSSEKTGTAWRVPCFFHFLVHSLGICDAMCTEVPWSQRCGTSLIFIPSMFQELFPSSLSLISLCSTTAALDSVACLFHGGF